MHEKKYGPLAIMVVDDDELGRKYLSSLLDGIGVGNALTAESGAGALRELEATDADVNLIICDVEMPEMNGFEFVRRIRDDQPRFGSVIQNKIEPALYVRPVLTTPGHVAVRHERQTRQRRNPDVPGEPRTSKTPVLCLRLRQIC